MTCAPAQLDLPGKILAADELGRPLISREMDGLGGGRTYVRNKDGSHRVFGLSTVKSLAVTKEADVVLWVQALTREQLRGFAHELGQRLVEASEQYRVLRKERRQVRAAADFRFFGLDGDASEKDIDNAYRRLAKTMHPDKNFGTEEAKLRFQEMKERYETLKERASNLERGRPGDESPRGGEEEHKGANITYDPNDRVGTESTVMRMLRDYRTIQSKVELLTKEVAQLQVLAAKLAGGIAPGRAHSLTY